MVANTSSYSSLSPGRWFGPMSTAFARKSWRTPVSPKNPTTLRTTSSNNGSARRAFSAARSAGCSQVVDEMSVRILRSGMTASNGADPAYRAVASPYGPGVAEVSRRALRLHAGLDPTKRLLEVLQQVVDVLHAARKAHESFRDAQRRAPRRLHRRMRHRGGMADERFH